MKVKRLPVSDCFEHKDKSGVIYTPDINQTLGYGLPLLSWKKQQHAVKSLNHTRVWMDGGEVGELEEFGPSVNH